jgi:hypothetical protein
LRSSGLLVTSCACLILVHCIWFASRAAIADALLVLHCRWLSPMLVGVQRGLRESGWQLAVSVPVFGCFVLKFNASVCGSQGAWQGEDC